ncbi:anthranilate synthase component I [Tengunoibacter tsumagoiensis]|uniref:Anthranilate synthase component 1 n=1 Tax=Tengunoibacter tsumagoiensis TaxID=2014871 RepID=A0A401ZZG6_9CHLR|nr:anthranilate synthase component I [Tengunoibacter tsumagoiensis]GCE12248.1 anthranilate synthase component I [Tengunoibacter tsumagoiensis]
MDYPIPYYPEYEEVLQLSKTIPQDGRRPLLPLYSDILADMETPVSAYCKTALRPYSFLLESVSGGEHVKRYSFIGLDPYLVMTQRGETITLQYMTYEANGATIVRTEELTAHDPLHFIEAELGQYQLLPLPDAKHDSLPTFHGGAVGYLSYDAAASFERLPVLPPNELNLPLAVFSFTETVLVFDHVKHHVRIVTHLHLDAPDLAAEYQRGMAIIAAVQQQLVQPTRLPEEPEPLSDPKALQVRSNRTKAEYEGMVSRAIEYIKAGDVFQVVPSQRLSRHVNASPFTIYRSLRAVNPSPYMFFLDLKEFQIVGASPELLVRYEDDEVTIRPIAGTRPRGADRQQDELLAEELQHDPKERAEHVMLLDLARNDVGRVSEVGSIKIADFMTIERYSHVMHLVTNVAGKLRQGLTPFEALRAGFPAGTVSGAPKIRAMEIISELEGEQRGVYAGAVGYFSHSGNQETAIALRTMVVKDGRAYIQAGAGVVADSTPEGEYQECFNKARALLRALDDAETIAQRNREVQKGGR